jgi:hypothetical protein
LIQFDGFLAVAWIDYAAAVVVIVIAIGLFFKLRQWFSVLPKSLFSNAKRYIGGSAITSSFLSVLARQVIGQKDIINDSRTRWLTHLLLFWGFVGLGVATVWDDVFFRQGDLPPPFSPANPGNIIGNIGGALVVIGATVMLVRYLVVPKFAQNPKGDMFFFIFLYVAVLSGFATEFSRYFGLVIPTFTIYLVHLVIVGALLISAPFTHFFHAVQVPFLRFVDRVHSALITKAKGILLDKRETFKPDFRRLIMTGANATNTKFPWWLEGESKKEDPESS